MSRRARQTVVRVAIWSSTAVAMLVVSGCKREAPESSNAPAASKPSEQRSYQDRLGAFETKLVRHAPAPQRFDPDLVPPPGVRAVTYASEGLTLKAWVAFPPGASTAAKVPGVVYLHGGFAFGLDDFEDARPFLDSGIAVMCPMLRGENGNPGDSEMYFGEVRDAKAAIAWLAGQDRVDAQRLYTFGHSAGGIISSLLSFHDVAIRHGGSAGALYGPELFDWMRNEVPFPFDDPRERSLRLLLGNARWMRHPHYAFAGDGDRNQRVAAARAEAAESGGNLRVATVPGDHARSLAPAVVAYVKVIQSTP